METSKQTYKQQEHIILFDREETMDKPNALDNLLEKPSKVVDFEMFNNNLETALYKEMLSNVGAKPYSHVLMFKLLVLLRMYHLNDKQTEYQIRDSMSFSDFLGLAIRDKVPDAHTIWTFKEELAKKGVFDQLFGSFFQFLKDNNMIMNEGIIIDRGGSYRATPARQPRSRFYPKHGPNYLHESCLQHVEI